MNPMTEVRDLCLASTATQKGDLSALASSTDTSRHHDNVPVLTQNLPDEQRSDLVRCFTLAASTSQYCSSGTQLAAWAGDPRTVSPCVLWDVHQKCLVRQQGALAQAYDSTNVLGTLKVRTQAGRK